jgi:HemY protein
MNRLLYILLISVITIVGFTMYQNKDLGLISFSFAGVSFQTNLVVFSAAVLCALFAVLALIKTWELIENIFNYLVNQRKQRLTDEAHDSLTNGFVEYTEGRFERSEKILQKNIKYSDNRLLVYLIAARAAQQLGAYERRDEYLRKAHLEAPDADIAIALTKAELQLTHEQIEQALATLEQINSVTENHPYVLSLLANTYKQLQDWDKLKQILPALKKHGKLSSENLLTFEVAVCNGQLSKLAMSNNSIPMIDFWNDTPSHLKVIPQVIEHYARELISVNAAGEAEKVLRRYLDKNWHESTIILFSELDVLVDNTQLETAESWLETHQQNAWLLLALGKMCISRSLWGKARNYLEASISIRPMPENYLKLARLLEEHMEEPAAAQEYYRQGLHLLAGDYGEDVLGNDFERETPQLMVVKT